MTMYMGIESSYFFSIFLYNSCKDFRLFRIYGSDLSKKCDDNWNLLGRYTIVFLNSVTLYQLSSPRDPILRLINFSPLVPWYQYIENKIYQMVIPIHILFGNRDECRKNSKKHLIPNWAHSSS
jgi:hypothetical protein